MCPGSAAVVENNEDRADHDMLVCVIAAVFLLSAASGFAFGLRIMAAVFCFLGAVIFLLALFGHLADAAKGNEG